MEKEIASVMHALENNQIEVVNDFLREKWAQDVNIFIESVAKMRSINPSLLDRHFNSGDFIKKFASH